MRVLLIIATLCVSLHANAQQMGLSKYLSFDDVCNFWKAYDKVVATNDSSEQVQIMQTVYLDKASFETKLLLKLSHQGASDYVRYIKVVPAFWRGLRERTRFLMLNYKKIDEALGRLRTFYKPLEIPDVNFMVGCFEFGGKPVGDKVMIGLEVVLADGNFDMQDFRNSSDAYQQYTLDATIYFALHEVIHTYQPDSTARDLLSMCVMEGSCDFITELVMGKPLQRPYIVLGNSFEKKIWESFKKEMNGFSRERWLYNRGLVRKGEEDLGYFMGYAICKSYYENADNRRKAIKKILNLNFSSNKDIYRFFVGSGYEKKLTASSN